MFGITLKKNKSDIYYKSHLQISKMAWFRISISNKSIFVYISRDKSRSYWIGRKKGETSKLSIIFNDKKRMITVNSSNRIIVHSIKDYTTIKQKAKYYKYIGENENKIVFEETRQT